jgi:hypothetical protein
MVVLGSHLHRLLKNAPAYRQAGICCVALILRRCSVHSSTPLADSLTRRRGKMSLLTLRDATLRISGALHLGIFNQPEKMTFSIGSSYVGKYFLKLSGRDQYFMVG